MSRFGAILWVLLLGEIRLQARQPLAVLLFLVMPIFVVPGGLVGTEVYLASLDEAATGQGGDEVPQITVVADPIFSAWVDRSDRMTVVADGAVLATGEGSADDPLAEVSVVDHTVTVRFRQDLAPSRAALSRIIAVVDRHRGHETDAQLADHGLAMSAAEVLVVDVVDRAAATRRGGDRLGALLPPLLFFGIVMVTIYTALDVISGEKERGTAETLLVSVPDRRVVVGAKGLLTAGIATVSGWIGLGSLGILAASGAVQLPSVLGPDGMQALTWLPMLWLALAVVLLAVVAAGGSLVVATWAPNYRIGSMISGPAMLVLLAPATLSLVPGVELSPWIAWVPIANIALACRGLLAGELGIEAGAWVGVASLTHATVAVVVAFRLLDREEALVPATGRGRRSLGFYGREAVAIWLLVLFLTWFFGGAATDLHPVWGSVFVQLILTAAVAFGAAGFLGVDLVDTLSLRGAPPIRWAGAVGVGALLPAVGLSLSAIPGVAWVALPPALAGEISLGMALVGFAVIPGICQELLYRGLLQGLLRRSLSPLARVSVVAVAFGVASLVPAQILPAVVLGGIVGWVVWRTGSVGLAIGIHGVHDLVWVGLSWGRSAVDLPLPWTLTGSVLALAGVGILCTGSSLPSARPRA